MICPRCKSETRVLDSRMHDVKNERMRRHQCINCKFRFTTWESTTARAPMKLEQKGWLEIKPMPYMGKVS